MSRLLRCDRCHNDVATTHLTARDWTQATIATPNDTDVYDLCPTCADATAHVMSGAGNPEAERLGNELAAARKRIVTVEAIAAGMTRDRDDLNRKLAAICREYDGAKEQLTASLADLVAVKQQLDATRELNEELTARAQAAELDLEAVRNERDEAREECERLEIALDTARDDLRTDRLDLEQQLAEVRRECRDLERQLDQMRSNSPTWSE